jgi:hypothetical protein
LKFTDSAFNHLQLAMREADRPLMLGEMRRILHGHGGIDERIVFPEVPPKVGSVDVGTGVAVETSPAPKVIGSAAVVTPWMAVPNGGNGSILNSVETESGPRIIKTAAFADTATERSAAFNPRSPLHMSESATLERTKIIAEKWSAVAEHGTRSNVHWGEVRNLRALDLYKTQLPQGSPDSLENAQWEMQTLMKKAHAMGFRPGDKETGGAYLERIGKELTPPITESQVTERSHVMWNVINKQVTVRVKLQDEAQFAQNYFGHKILPGMETTAEGKNFLQIQNIMQRLYNASGLPPAKGEGVDQYGERVLRVLLKKTPTLHTDMILKEIPVKAVVPPPVLAPASTTGKNWI